MKRNSKTAKQMERNLKGIANHWRIEMILLIEKEKSLTLEEIVEILNMNEKTASEHTRRLVQAGLVNKNYKGRTVEHTLSPYGKIFADFIKTFQHS
jgi:DNA-binding transcriptional ArsR family regulator